MEQGEGSSGARSQGQFLALPGGSDQVQQVALDQRVHIHLSAEFAHRQHIVRGHHGP